MYVLDARYSGPTLETTGLGGHRQCDHPNGPHGGAACCVTFLAILLGLQNLVGLAWLAAGDRQRPPAVVSVPWLHARQAPDPAGKDKVPS